MPALFIYLIKANIALMLFYLAYRFGLRRLTFYTLNRYFLLIGIAFSAFFPLVDINTFFQQHEQLAGSVTYYAVDWNSLQHYMTQQDPFTIWTLLQYIFWTGVAVMFIRFFIQLLSLFRIHVQARNEKINNEKVKVIPDKINPFSFFKNIYINPSLHSPEELKTILVHEKIHVRQWHTLDVLTGEMNTIFYWFNPGAWLMKTAIRENLEFITDRKLVRSGINAKNYQYSLLRTVNGLQSTSLANNFNFSHLKQRIRMMNKKRSSEFHLFRYLLLLPFIAVVALMVTSSRGQSTQTKNQVSAFTDTTEILKNDKGLEIDTTHPMMDKRPEDYKAFLKRNPSVKSLGWVIIPKEKGQSLKGYIPKGEKMKVSNGKVAGVKVFMKNGETEYYHSNNKKEIKAAEKKYGDFPKPLNFILTPSDPFKDTVNPYKEENSFSKGYKSFLKRNPSVISLNRVFTKNNKVLAIWVTPKKGPIEIYHLNNQEEMKAARKKYGNFPKLPSPSLSKSKVKYTPPKVVEDTALRNALYIVNGKIIDKKDLKQKHIDFHEIDSISILKGKSAKEKYGEKAKNGAIEYFIDKDKKIVRPKIHFTPPRVIKDTTIMPQDKQDKGPKVKVHFTLPKIQTHTISNGNKPYTVTTFNKAYSIPIAMFVDTVPKNSPPAKAVTIGGGTFKGLVLIDGKIKPLEELNADEIRSMSVLKGQAAIEKYGEKGENGVIEIYTKEFMKEHPQWHPDSSAITVESKTGVVIGHRLPKNDPIYIIDDKIKDSNYLKQHISLSDIQSISVLKGTKAVSLYGKKAKDGAIIITTKEHAKKHRSF